MNAPEDCSCSTAMLEVTVRVLYIVVFARESGLNLYVCFISCPAVAVPAVYDKEPLPQQTPCSIATVYSLTVTCRRLGFQDQTLRARKHDDHDVSILT